MTLSCCKKLSALLRGIASNHVGDFYCLNCFHSYSKENKFKKYMSVCKNHDYCYVEIPKEDNKILKDNHGEKSMKVSFIIYADIESLLEKINMCNSNLDNSSTTKINLHAACCYSLFTHCTFDKTKYKLDYYRSKDCMKSFCKDLKKTCNRNNKF